MRKELLRFMRDFSIAKTQPFSNNSFGTFVRSEIPQAIYKTDLLSQSQYLVTASVGAGNWAMIPWICIFDRNITTSATKGVYIVYLLSADSQRLYLTFNQGCTEISQTYSKKETIEKLHENAEQIRKMINSRGFIGQCNINLGEKLTKLGELYREGTIYYTQYQINALPDEDTLRDDLSDMIAIYKDYAQNRPITKQQKKKVSKESSIIKRNLPINPAGPIDLEIIVKDYSEYLSSVEQLHELLYAHYPLCKIEIDLILDAFESGIAEDIASISEIRSFDLWTYIQQLKDQYSLSLEYALIAIKYWLDAYSVSMQDSLNSLLSCYLFQTIKYKDGKIYRGQLQKGKEHGHGIMSFPDGRLYEGEWKNGNFHGKGRLTQANGLFYDGDWLNGSAHGNGHLLLDNNFVYDGEFRDGKMNGHGHQAFSDGSSYTGEYKDGAFCGHGIMYYTNGGFYQGEWFNDKKHGYGCEKNDRYTLIGNFENGIFQNGHFQAHDDIGNILDIETDTCNYDQGKLSMQGKGYIHLANGGSYYGDIIDLHMSGKGCYRDANGFEYMGEFSEKFINGYGLLKIDDYIWGGKFESIQKEDGYSIHLQGKGFELDLSDMKLCCGDWIDGNLSGHAYSEKKDGSIYIGDYIKGKQQGKGYLILKDGSIYDGWFYKNKKNGHGRLISSDGTIKSGIWVDDILMKHKSDTEEIHGTDASSSPIKPNQNKPLVFDPLKIKQSRTESIQLRDKLLFPQDEDYQKEQTLNHLSQLNEQTKTKIKFPQSDPITFDLKKIDRLRVESDQLRDTLIESVEEPINEAKQITEESEASHENKVIQHQSKETEFDWQMFFDRIKAYYDLDVLYALLLGKEEFQSYTKRYNILPNVLLDEINNIAMDTIGDLIADENGITEDYAKIVEQFLTNA